MDTIKDFGTIKTTVCQKQQINKRIPQKEIVETRKIEIINFFGKKAKNETRKC